MRIAHICLFILFFCLFNYSYAEEIRKADYLNNNYYSPIVKKMEQTIRENKNVNEVLVYEAEDPFPLYPDMFSIKIELVNGNIILVRGITEELNFYGKWSGIDRINDIYFAFEDSEDFSMFIPYSYFTVIVGTEFTLCEFINSFDEFSKVLYSLPKYFTRDETSDNNSVNQSSINDFQLFRWN